MYDKTIDLEEKNRERHLEVMDPINANTKNLWLSLILSFQTAKREHWKVTIVGWGQLAQN
jgi:hypothetical protein